MIAQSERRAATVSRIVEAARKLFAAHGFAETSIDAVATEAGVTKGAVYHHFSSKEEILDRLVDRMQADISAEVPEAARRGKNIVDSIRRGTLKYLTAITEPDERQILLVDGPAVLGWKRWREIDQRYFFPLMREPLVAALQSRMTPREIEAIGHLIAGAMMEAALVCATSETPQRTAKEMAHGLGKLLEPLLASE